MDLNLKSFNSSIFTFGARYFVLLEKMFGARMVHAWCMIRACTKFFEPWHYFNHYFYRDNSKQFLLKKCLFPCTLSTTDDINYKPIDMYLLKSTNRSTKTSCEICSKLAKGMPEQSR